MSGKLEQTISLLEKKFGKGVIGVASKYKGIEVKRVPTGSFSLDVETGGGYPQGRVIELYGELSSGKTMLALKAVAEIQRIGKKAVWIDAEGCFDNPWAKALGVNVDKLFLVKHDTAESMLDIADALLRSKDCGIVVIDSVASLMPVLEEEVAMTENEKVGDRALMMNRFMRKVQSALNLRSEDQVPNDCLVILINQVRVAIGSYGDPTTTPGGKGIGFAASIRVLVRRKEWIKEGKGDNEKVVGIVVKFKTTKNKTFSPFRDGGFDFYTADAPEHGFKKGEIDTVKEIIQYGIVNGVIKQEGTYYGYGSYRDAGKEKLIAFIKGNPKDAIKMCREVIEVVTNPKELPKEELDVKVEG